MKTINKKEIFLISIAVFLTVLAWVMADFYHSAVIKNIEVEAKDLNIFDLDITFNKEVFDKLKLKK